MCLSVSQLENIRDTYIKNGDTKNARLMEASIFTNKTYSDPMFKAVHVQSYLNAKNRQNIEKTKNKNQYSYMGINKSDLKIISVAITVFILGAAIYKTIY